MTDYNKAFKIIDVDKTNSKEVWLLIYLLCMCECDRIMKSKFSVEEMKIFNEKEKFKLRRVDEKRNRMIHLGVQSKQGLCISDQ